VTVYHGDCREVVPALMAGRVVGNGWGDVATAVIADPPYQETGFAWDRWPDGWPATMIGVARSMWCFGSLRMFMARAGEFAMWTLSQDVMWRKTLATGARGDRFRRAHESIGLFYRGRWQDVWRQPVRVAGEVTQSGKRRPRRGATVKSGWHGHKDNEWTDDGSRMATSVIESPNMWKRNPRAKTEKPVRVLDPLIRYSVPPGGVVLDPFAGSGSTGEAARLAGRKAILIEADEAACDTIARRMLQGFTEPGPEPTPTQAPPPAGLWE
jgi:site-specific DNA-methyltransferase (adenine-specific)